MTMTNAINTYAKAINGTITCAAFAIDLTPPIIIEPNKITIINPVIQASKPKAFSTAPAIAFDWTPGIRISMAIKAATAKMMANHFCPIPFSI